MPPLQSPITHVKLATSQNPIFTVIFMSCWSVCGYEQNPSRGVGVVAHTRFPHICYIVVFWTKRIFDRFNISWIHHETTYFLRPASTINCPQGLQNRWLHVRLSHTSVNKIDRNYMKMLFFYILTIAIKVSKIPISSCLLFLFLFAPKEQSQKGKSIIGHCVNILIYFW